jgi:hypothetical protein
MSSKCIPCGQGGDNANPTCPILHDYRAFTDYRPRCASVYQQTQANQFASSYDMREFFIHNADDLMKQNALDAYMNMQCKCVEPYDQGTMLPELQKQTCTDRVCTFNVNDKYGLGLGRQFYDPATEQEFRGKFVAEKEKEQSYFKENSCCGTANDALYWPIDGTPMTQYDRYSVPSGGQQLSVGGQQLSVGGQQPRQ